MDTGGMEDEMSEEHPALVQRLFEEDRHVLRDERRTATEAVVLAAVVGLGGLALVALETLGTTGVSDLFPRLRAEMEAFREAGGFWDVVLWLFGLFVALLVVVALSRPYRDVDQAGAEVARSRFVAAVRALGMFVVAGLILQMAVTVSSALRGAGLLQHVVELVACALLGTVAVSLSSTAPGGLLGPALTAQNALRDIEYFTTWGETRLPVRRRGYRRILAFGIALLVLGLLIALVQAVGSGTLGAGPDSGPAAGFTMGIFIVVVALWTAAAWWTCGFATTFRRSSFALEQYLGLGITHATASLYLCVALTATWQSWGALAVGPGTALAITGGAGLWTLSTYESPSPDSRHRLSRRHAHRLAALRGQLDRALKAFDAAESPAASAASTASTASRARRDRIRRFHRPYRGRH